MFIFSTTDFTSKYWLVITIKTDGIKTVNRNPPGRNLCLGELGIFDIKISGGFRALNSDAVISPNHLSNGSK